METTEQTEQSVSVEDKIADIFAGKEAEEAAADDVQADGDEPTEDATEEAVSESEFAEIEFDGETFQVPPKLKDAFMRESDYTQKTQQLSSQRKEIELQQKEIVLAREREAFHASVKEDISQIEMLDAYIKHVNQNTNWAEMDVNQAFKAKMELDQLKEQREEIKAKLAEKHQAFQANLETKRSEIRAEAEKHLSKAIPNWSKAKGEIEGYVKSLGYPDIGVQNMSSLDYQVAHKAMLYDQLKVKTPEAVKKASSAPAIKPTARKEMPKAVRGKLDYRNKVKSAKSVHERSKLAENRLGEIFSR